MIEASRCPSCQRTATPPETRCLSCRTSTEGTRLEPQGRVLTYTDQEGWIALVELEGQARVLARADEEPSIGEEVRLEQAPEAGYRVQG